MSVRFSPVIDAQLRELPAFNSLQFIDLQALGVHASPLAVLDDFRVADLPSSAHPHAGFAAAAYVFEDSAGGVRSRASTGADLVIGPGGIVWTQTGRGVIHEEVPAQPGVELHGLQLFVNVTSENRLAAPRVLHLEGRDVPEGQSDAGDRVRVVVGTFDGTSAPLVPRSRASADSRASTSDGLSAIAATPESISWLRAPRDGLVRAGEHHVGRDAGE